MVVALGTDSKYHANPECSETASTVYTYDSAKQTIVVTLTVGDAEAEAYWFGTRNDKTYNTVGPCAVRYNGFYCQFYAAGAGTDTPGTDTPGTDTPGTDTPGTDTPAAGLPGNLSFTAAANKADGDTYLSTNFPTWTITGTLGQTYGGYLGFGRGTTATRSSAIKSSAISVSSAFTVTAVIKGNGSSGVMTSTLTFTLVDASGNTIATGYANGSTTAAITPVDAGLIPTGELMSVEGTPFDFRTPHAIGERVNEEHPQLKAGAGYDHNFVINREDNGEVIKIADIYSPKSGRGMEVWSDQIALQFYCGNFFDGSYNNKYGKPILYRGAFALETQRYPDAPNQTSFPTIVLEPGQVYKHTCIYKFYSK